MMTNPNSADSPAKSVMESTRPKKPRYGTYSYKGDREEIAVQVKAPDFNGASFDGCPFSALPSWLMELIRCGDLTPHTRNSTDYAEWDVTTFINGALGKVSLSPGDWLIRLETGALSVVREAEAYILINLRPPVKAGESEMPLRGT